MRLYNRGCTIGKRLPCSFFETTTKSGISSNFERPLKGPVQQIGLLKHRMTTNRIKPKGTPPPLRRAGAHWAHERTSLPDREQNDLKTPPPEVAFLAGVGLPLELLADAVAVAELRAVDPLAWLLSEGKIAEEDYYRALANHLSCTYYSGDPPPLQVLLMR